MVSSSFLIIHRLSSSGVAYTTLFMHCRLFPSAGLQCGPLIVVVVVVVVLIVVVVVVVVVAVVFMDVVGSPDDEVAGIQHWE